MARMVRCSTDPSLRTVKLAIAGISGGTVTCHADRPWQNNALGLTAVRFTLAKMITVNKMPTWEAFKCLRRYAILHGTWPKPERAARPPKWVSP